MNDSKVQVDKSTYVPYVILNGDEQIPQEIFDLTEMILKTPNDKDLGKIIRERFLKRRK